MAILSWSEIRSRAYAFSNEWRGTTKENAESQSFWNDFFQVFGVNRRRVASFEHSVKKLSGTTGRIDCFWPGKLLVEQKSRGEDLSAAEGQANDYLAGIADNELPRYLLVSDFERFRLDDLEGDEYAEFTLETFPEHIKRFAFVAGYQQREVREQDPVNQLAAEAMGELHDHLQAVGYGAPDLDRFLVRLLFCLFADDTGIFAPADTFEYYLKNHTHEDGSDLGMHLDQVFQLLDTPLARRQTNLDEDLAAFPYVNGGLFEGRLRTPAFDAAMRRTLLRICTLDWSGVSPAIFGSMFQAAMDPVERRVLGAHYTSEENILKALGPLFLDDLNATADRYIAASRGAGQRGRADLQRTLTELASYRILDPACGSGNFLIIAYRELRRVELRLVEEDLRRSGTRMDAVAASGINVRQFLRVTVDQFYGIEIDSFAARVAETAMWLIDHQMNREASAKFGELIARIPIEATPHILNADALRADWATCFGESQPARFDFILGNPPFYGAKFQTKEQKAALKTALKGVKSAGLLDFVTGWFVKAGRYVREQPDTRVAFVSTNSIAQGEQPGVLWRALYGLGMQVQFAHQTFRWTNLAKGKAAVHVVITGFGVANDRSKRLFAYEDIDGAPLESQVPNINPYLLPGGDAALLRRSRPWPGMPAMGIGNKPIDGGHYLFTPEEKADFVAREPQAGPYFRRWYGSQEFIQGIERWCLWLGDADSAALRHMPLSLKRVEAVRDVRLASDSAPTNKLAATPRRFHVEFLPQRPYMIVPKVSSQRRAYIPMGFSGPETMASDLVLVVQDATLYHLGVLSSAMHMGWMRYTAGRLKSDYRYSASVVYNNYPWPTPTPKQRTAIEAAAQGVLDARQPHLARGNTLADLYDPLSMPQGLARAHQSLDRAVDLAYRPNAFPDERRRVEWLFKMWEAFAG